MSYGNGATPPPPDPPNLLRGKWGLAPSASPGTTRAAGPRWLLLLLASLVAAALLVLVAVVILAVP